MKKTQFEKGFAEGATSSINKTLEEIEKIMKGEELSDAGPLRSDLRDAIENALIELATRWYKKGFNRGHKESYEKYVLKDKFPKRITTTVSRKLLPNAKEEIELGSTIKKDFKLRVEKKLKKKK
ncbi:hypothetical protein [Pontiella agarivorans]|uniref:Uncharacterized protein n=1 Tax=Pontiella agarivorans TaxID=3038953 RepID=A0ABU5N113_9BACT|nr:hypothetical protein [Pontiella agarivorans]MDZ8120140.1 hypothetical protein [Pontiella agarivorans]